jgi:hypothetical protein
MCVWWKSRRKTGMLWQRYGKNKKAWSESVGFPAMLFWLNCSKKERKRPEIFRFQVLVEIIGIEPMTS